MAKDEAVLISIHAEHAQKILFGEKSLEFRRVWATRAVSSIVIYVTAPLKKIVAIVRIKKVHQGTPNDLWQIAKVIGGGLTRKDLYRYMEGKSEGYAIELESVQRFHPYLDPKKFLEDFRAPQSFSYVPTKAFLSLARELEKQRKIARGHVLFVGGVHGVGKTTLCEHYVETHGVMHKSSGQLIKEMRHSSAPTSSKAVNDIHANQRLLIDAVKRIRSAGKTLLLDGHFALLDTHHNPKPLSTEVFSALGIDSVAVVFDTPKAIASRLAARDGHGMLAKDIETLQEMELLRAAQVARELCVPFVKIKSADTVSFEAAIVGTLTR